MPARQEGRTRTGLLQPQGGVLAVSHTDTGRLQVVLMVVSLHPELCNSMSDAAPSPLSLTGGPHYYAAHLSAAGPAGQACR